MSVERFLPCSHTWGGVVYGVTYFLIFFTALKMNILTSIMERMLFSLSIRMFLRGIAITLSDDGQPIPMDQWDKARWLALCERTGFDKE